MGHLVQKRPILMEMSQKSGHLVHCRQALTEINLQLEHLGPRRTSSPITGRLGQCIQVPLKLNHPPQL